MRHAMSTASGTPFDQASFTPLLDASNSFFFPMVTRRHVVVAVGVEARCGGGREVRAMAGTMSVAF
jgi:hypothetical protein